MDAGRIFDLASRRLDGRQISPVSMVCGLISCARRIFFQKVGLISLVVMSSSNLAQNFLNLFLLFISCN